MKQINIKGLENYYCISPDGVIYSNIRKRLLTPQTNSCGYLMIHLAVPGDKGKSYMLARVVALTYIGDPPDNSYEVNHIDHNKKNNHYSNLEWITHSENLQKSFDGGFRSRLNCGRPKGYKASEQAKKLMSEKKFKKVSCFNVTTSETVIYDSIEDLINNIPNMYRKKFNRILNGTSKSDYIFTFI
jgi:hypothetical protein